MSGLLALLDDVAGIAKVAAASVDDVIGQASKAGAKAAGALIDDAAVTPKYVQGFKPDRELPIVWKIAKGSIFNKVVILLPLAMILSNFAPWLIPPLLMLGGIYLCFEGAEKVLHVLGGDTHAHAKPDSKAPAASAAHLEEAKVAGAIKTDFILSAEIMTIALSALPPSGFFFELAALFLVAIGITVLVYGSVAIIVKADDVGLHLATEGITRVGRALGRGIVAGMPTFLKLLLIVGTAAMVWVGGSIILHALEQMGWAAPAHMVHDIAHGVGQGNGALEWVITAGLDGILGLAVGIVTVPVVTRLIAPLLAGLKRA
jgi:predicted DNA repair protein MutK